MERSGRRLPTSLKLELLFKYGLMPKNTSRKIAKTNYEMKGKQPPTDLVSTASNPNRNSGSGDKKRSYRSVSTKKTPKISYDLDSPCDPKENSPHNGVNMKYKKGSGASGSSSPNKRNAPLKPVSSRKKKKLHGDGLYSKQPSSVLSQKKQSLKLNLSEILKDEPFELSDSSVSTAYDDQSDATSQDSERLESVTKPKRKFRKEEAERLDYFNELSEASTAKRRRRSRVDEVQFRRLQPDARLLANLCS